MDDVVLSTVALGILSIVAWRLFKGSGRQRSEEVVALRTRMERALRDYAGQAGFRVEGAERRAVGLFGRTALTIEIAATWLGPPQGRGAVGFVTVRAELPRARRGWLRLAPRDRIQEVSGDVQFPDPAFTRRFSVYAGNHEKALALIDERARRALVDFPERPLWLTCERTYLKLWWRSPDLGGVAGSIDAATAIVAELCAPEIATDSPYRD